MNWIAGVVAFGAVFATTSVLLVFQIGQPRILFSMGRDGLLPYLESPRLVFGRVVLIGDAAFVARPHAGMGVTKAALDALSLAGALAAPDPAAALAQWECQRLRYGRAVVKRARWLGAYLEEPVAAPEAWPAQAKQLAATLMAETAISGWLRE